MTGLHWLGLVVGAIVGVFLGGMAGLLLGGLAGLILAHIVVNSSSAPRSDLFIVRGRAGGRFRRPAAALTHLTESDLRGRLRRAAVAGA